MDEIRNEIKKSINKLENNDSPIAETIYNHINKAQFDKDLNGIQIFKDAVNELENIEESKSEGIEDSLESIRKDLDHVAGQINTTVKVINAGAGPHKAAEYIENASESLGNALDKINKLVDFIIGESEFSDESLTDNPERIQSRAIPAEMDLENIKIALDDSIDKLK